MNSSYTTSFGNVELVVTPDKMYQAADSIERKIRLTKNKFAKMVDIISATSQYWDGAVADQERRNFTNENENFEAMISNLKNYVNELRAITSIYEVSERGQTELAESLPTNILE